MIQDMPVRLPTRRALAKQQTRSRLIAAAKALVSERGYEAATLREVAALARVSTGAVFANFADKADLFNAVVIEDYAELLVQMKQAAGRTGLSSERLLNAFSAGYTLHFERLALMQAQLGFSWSNDRGLEQRRRFGLRPILDFLAEILRAGLQAGELSASIEVDLTVEMAWDNYVANYRRAIFDDWTMEALCDRVGRQIDVLLDGYRIDDRQDAPISWPGASRVAETPPLSRMVVERRAALRG